MRNLNITKADLKNQIEYLFGSWIEVDFNNLKQAFGYKRVPGLAMAVNQLLRPSKTEAELSIEPDHVIHDNIKEWCKENNIECKYFEGLCLPLGKGYRFRYLAGFDRILSTILSKIGDQDRTFCKRPRMVVLNIKIARSFYDQQVMNNAAFSSTSPDGKFKILGLDVVEATNVDKDFVELIY